MIWSDRIFASTALLLLSLFFFALGPQRAQAQIGDSQKINETAGNFSGSLNDGVRFGRSIARIGDLNGDGNSEIAVGTSRDDDGGSNRGAVWILFPNDNGTVSKSQKISDTKGGFGGVLDDDDFFGSSVARVSALGSTGNAQIAVGAPKDDDGGSNRGAVWILTLNDDGTVASQQKISDTVGGFTGVLNNDDRLGDSITRIGDLDSNGTLEIAVGAIKDDDGGTNRGALWILSLSNDGTVASHEKISSTQGGFSGTLNDTDFFGESAAHLGDLDGNGTPEVAVGAVLDDDGGFNRGAVWILSLASDGTVAAQQKISDAQGGFTGLLDDEDLFGISTASAGDLNEDGTQDLLVGANFDDDGGTNRGAVWVLYLNDDGSVARDQKVSDKKGEFTGTLSDEGYFGAGVAHVGDLDGDSLPDLVVGADGDGNGRGTVWVLFGNESILPVELTTFEPTQTGEASVELTWTTASEQNNSGFHVQHKGPQNTDWEKVGFVPTKARGGTTSQETTYRFDARNLAVGTHRFRLKQVDLDGTTHLHDPVSITMRMTRAVRLSAPAPNPVRNATTLSFAVKEAQRTTLALYNVLGQKVSTLYRGTPTAEERHTVRLDAEALPSGPYVIRLRTGEQVKTRRLTIVR